jgi:hexosaminidase
MLLIALALATVTADEPRLIPHPRELTVTARVSLRGGVSVSGGGNAGDRFAAKDLGDALRERGVRVSDAGAVRIVLSRLSGAGVQARLAAANVRFDDAMRDEGYVVIAGANRVDVIAATAAGLFYGAQTVKQLVEGSGPSAWMHGARIRDWPAMRWRGFHDDLSRGPVPTLEFQKKQIRTFAAYKLNVYSPYYEHTLTYRSHPLVAPAGGAMTQEEVRELVEYARRYHIDVVPEQEAFGHLHHMLKHEIYSTLGETEHGHVLAPGNPRSMTVIRDMFAEIDSLFPSRFIHLGADETFELGRGQTNERVRNEGIGKVYLGFLGDIVRAVSPNGATNKKFLFWGDVAMNHPDLVKDLPKGLIAVAWNYWSRDKFDPYLVPFRDAGIETWVAPGVNSWNRVWPNYDAALPNIQGFIRDGQRLGSTGVLNTSWDDDGESIFNQTWYGVIFGAAASWQVGETSIPEFQRSFGRVFHGDTTGAIDAAQRHLIAAHATLGRARLGDASDVLFWQDPWTAEGQTVSRQVMPVARELRIHAESALVLLAQARASQRLREADALDAMALGARRIDGIGLKFQFADEVARMYGNAYAATTDTSRATSPDHDLSDISGINGRLQDLRDLFGTLRDDYERAWLAENRPYWRHNVLGRFDLATQTWIARIDKIHEARQQYNRTRRLPTAAEVGIPEVKPAVTVVPDGG